MTRIAMLLLVLAACGADAETNDLTCTGEMPFAVSGVQSVGGIVLDEIGGRPIAGALVEVRRLDGQALSRDFTLADGSYSTLVAGGVERFAQADGYLDAYVVEPRIGGEWLPLPMLTPDGADLLARRAGVHPDPTAGMALMVVLDCAGRPVPGAKISSTAAQVVMYLDAETRFDPTLTETSIDSAALLVGLQPGPASITVTVDGLVYRPLTIESRAGALVTAWPRP